MSVKLRNYYLPLGRTTIPPCCSVGPEGPGGTPGIFQEATWDQLYKFLIGNTDINVTLKPSVNIDWTGVSQTRSSYWTEGHGFTGSYCETDSTQTAGDKSIWTASKTFKISCKPKCLSLYCGKPNPVCDVHGITGPPISWLDISNWLTITPGQEPARQDWVATNKMDVTSDADCPGWPQIPVPGDPGCGGHVSQDNTKVIKAIPSLTLDFANNFNSFFGAICGGVEGKYYIALQMRFFSNVTFTDGNPINNPFAVNWDLSSGMIVTGSPAAWAGADGDTRFDSIFGGFESPDGRILVQEKGIGMGAGFINLTMRYRYDNVDMTAHSEDANWTDETYPCRDSYSGMGVNKSDTSGTIGTDMDGEAS